jgi:hypothetical protein
MGICSTSAYPNLTPHSSSRTAPSSLETVPGLCNTSLWYGLILVIIEIFNRMLFHHLPLIMISHSQISVDRTFGEKYHSALR